MGKLSMMKALGKSKEDRVKDAIARSNLVENLPEPSQDLLNKLVDLKIASIENSKFVYSILFKDSFSFMMVHPPGKLEQTKIAYKLNDELIPLILVHGASIFKAGKREYENLVAAYVAFTYHCNLNDIKVESKDIPNIIYGIFYLNDNSPSLV